MRDLQYMIDVITAAKAGKQLQWSNKDCIEKEWMNINPNASEWNWAKYNYRIAPEPQKAREWMILVCDPNSDVITKNSRWVKVREVLPDEARTSK